MHLEAESATYVLRFANVSRYKYEAYYSMLDYQVLENTGWLLPFNLTQASFMINQIIRSYDFKIRAWKRTRDRGNSHKKIGLRRCSQVTEQEVDPDLSLTCT